MNDMDYVNFVYDEENQRKLQEKEKDDRNLTLLNKFPEIKIPNKFFRNNGELVFQDMKDSIGNDQSTYSNGAMR